MPVVYVEHDVDCILTLYNLRNRKRYPISLIFSLNVYGLIFSFLSIKKKRKAHDFKVEAYGSMSIVAFEDYFLARLQIF